MPNDLKLVMAAELVRRDVPARAPPLHRCLVHLGVGPEVGYVPPVQLGEVVQEVARGSLYIVVLSLI